MAVQSYLSLHGPFSAQTPSRLAHELEARPHGLARTFVHIDCSRTPLPVGRSFLKLKLRSHAVARLSGDSRIDPIVSTDWLSRRLKDVCILDVRGTVLRRAVEDGVERSDYIANYDGYLEGHIPGTVFFNWVEDGVVRESNIPLQLTTDTEEFSILMEGKGISTDKPVVIYDRGDGLLAPRVWWSLFMHGHPHVLVLDGGWKKWIEEERETEITEPCPLKIYAKFDPIDVDFIPRITATELLNSIVEQQPHDTGANRESPIQIVDARSQEQYSGLIRQSKHGGRIPGAINIPWKLLLEPSGLHKDIEKQRTVFLNAGVNPDKTARLVAYSNGGVSSCTILLAWFRAGGHGSWANYDGSWNEWGDSDHFPKA